MDILTGLLLFEASNYFFWKFGPNLCKFCLDKMASQPKLPYEYAKMAPVCILA